jgi:starvation-inducible DNA-binding protein
MHNLVDGYKVVIASNFALYMKTHQAHFNVTGMFFPMLHEFFKGQYEDLFEAHDAIGENMRKLDAYAPQSFGLYAKYTMIDDCDMVMDATGYLTRLLQDHDRMIALYNKVFKLAEAENRQDHMNFIAERLDAHGKMRWMIKSTLESVAKLTA